jgi:hypothetical protein
MRWGVVSREVDMAPLLSWVMFILAPCYQSPAHQDSSAVLSLVGIVEGPGNIRREYCWRATTTRNPSHPALFNLFIIGNPARSINFEFSPAGQCTMGCGCG